MGGPPALGSANQLARAASAVSMETERGAGEEPPGPAMEPGARRGTETPRGVALTGRVPPGHGGDTGDVTPPCTVRIRGDVLLPLVAPCRGDMAEEPPGMVVGGGEEHQEMLDTDEEQQEELVATAEEIPKVLAMAKEPPEVPAPMPVEEPRQVVPRGSCLIRNWQEERATNGLDRVLAPEMGSEGFVHRHGHRGLLARQPPAQPPPSTTSEHTFRPPHRIPMLARGQREALLELMLYQKYRRELLEERCPPRAPMERLSTTHRDFQAGGFQPTPLPTTQPHNYHTEQPRSFWLEQARSVPGVTCIRTGDSPFRRNAAFSTPIAEYLEQPLPHVAESYGVRPSKQ
ncbi:sperm-associated antigen 8 [Cygnus atratus]|uniref:sperm-associated antigen 8 n=1 Tax=Cygnus atratus TaxID=8868 RepID=UPI0021B7E093|nr:sperm-associated antigen 8 [Cygnus atratus]